MHYRRKQFKNTCLRQLLPATPIAFIVLALSVMPGENAPLGHGFCLKVQAQQPLNDGSQKIELRQLNDEFKSKLRAKEYYKAEKLARKMLDQWPGMTIPYQSMGEVKKAQRIYSEALKYFTQALSKSGDKCEVLIDRADLYKLMDEDALVLADCRLALTTKNIRASQCLHLAQMLAAIDSPLECIAACDKGLALRSDNFNLLRLKATNLSSLKRFGEAEIVLRKILEKNPQDDKSLRELAFVQSYMKKYAEAIVNFDALIKLGREREVRQLEVLQERAQCHFALGHYDKSIDDLSACIKMYPLNRYLYSRRAEAYLKQGNVAKAKADQAKLNEFDRSFKPL